MQATSPASSAARSPCARSTTRSGGWRRRRAPVFITGESGTGKEVCAEAIHRAAGAGERPFIAINCSAIPRDLMESEIFGHVRGAFTGASAEPAGAAELANGGTLFLDEIAEMDLALQAKLLRFVQTGTHPAGRRQRAEAGRCPLHLRHQPRSLRRGRGRPLPRRPLLPAARPPASTCRPLRERRRGRPAARRSPSSRRFAAEEGRTFRGFEPEAAELILAYPWPGNVRQLENVDPPDRRPSRWRRRHGGDAARRRSAASANSRRQSPTTRAASGSGPGHHPRSGSRSGGSSRRRSPPSAATSGAPPRRSKSARRPSTASARPGPSELSA